jgi:hypothetical protein
VSQHHQPYPRGRAHHPDSGNRGGGPRRPRSATQPNTVGSPICRRSRPRRIVDYVAEDEAEDEALLEALRLAARRMRELADLIDFIQHHKLDGPEQPEPKSLTTPAEMPHASQRDQPRPVNGHRWPVRAWERTR